MQITFVGSGDAFGSGGRFNTCFHVTCRPANFLIDCGASSLIALKKFQIDPNAIRTILITHFHVDHFGGIPTFLLDARFFSKRITPLTIAGPSGIEVALQRYRELCFPGSSRVNLGFELEVRELEAGQATDLNGLSVTPYQVSHGDPGGPYFAYRIGAEGKTIAYTGDTAWTDELITAGRETDLFIAEAYFRDRPVKLHLDLGTLERHLPAIRPKRLILTHMSEDMLRACDQLEYETAEDGLVVEI
jgi:ribonuclease BN (tRNA processing enzyme)